ncbi:hypothetical protein DRB89_36895 [Streptomyces sp. ICC4]|nr:hypothetical protein DRB89_36895 [Streptomyces sp. ICC4]
MAGPDRQGQAQPGPSAGTRLAVARCAARAGGAMTGRLAAAHGSPSRTLVLPAKDFADGARDPERLLAELGRVREDLVRAGLREITKIALIGPSSRPGHQLDYRFVQVLPGTDPGFELRGSCGHSILAACSVAGRSGELPPLRTGQRIRVNVLNNGDSVECAVEETGGDRERLSASFLLSPAIPLRDLLLFGSPVTELPYRGGTVEVTGASMGNPYVFVRAADFGVRGPDELFAAGEALFAALSEVRRTAQAALGWPPGVFPKIAALLPLGPGRLAARAISVPSWHPTLALTGAVCLAAAARVPGSLPRQLAGADGADWVDGADGTDGGEQPLRVRTPGRWASVTARTAPLAPLAPRGGCAPGRGGGQPRAAAGGL